MKKNDKKKVILEVARKKFSKFGFLKTTVEEIAKAARIGKASIYHYFTSKETLFKEVVEQDSRFLKEKMLELLNQEITPQQKMKAYILNRIKYLQEMSNVHSALKDNNLEHYAFIENMRYKSLQEEISIIQTILKEGIEQDIFTIKDTEKTAFAIITAMNGLEYPWTETISLPTIESNQDQMLELIFNGIMKR